MSGEEKTAYGCADLPIETVEVLCDALECLYNDRCFYDKGEGCCCSPDVIIRKGRCTSYEQDKEFMKYSLRAYLAGDITYPRKFTGKGWIEV